MPRISGHGNPGHSFAASSFSRMAAFADHEELALDRRNRLQILPERLEIHPFRKLLDAVDGVCNVAESIDRVVKRQAPPRAPLASERVP